MSVWRIDGAGSVSASLLPGICADICRSCALVLDRENVKFPRFRVCRRLGLSFSPNLPKPMSDILPDILENLARID